MCKCWLAHTYLRNTIYRAVIVTAVKVGCGLFVRWCTYIALYLAVESREFHRKNKRRRGDIILFIWDSRISQNHKIRAGRSTSRFVEKYE